MLYYLFQAVAFGLVYWISYLLGGLACRGVNALLKRPMALTPHMAGISMVYSVLVVYLAMLVYVMVFSPEHYQLASFASLFDSIPALVGAAGAFGVAIVPCVIFILLLNMLQERRARANPPA